MTAADAAWTINTTIKYANGAAAVQAAVAQPREERDRAELDDARDQLRRLRSGTRSALLAGIPMRAAARLGAVEKKGKAGKGLKTYRPEGHLPMVTGGAYTVKQYEKKGTTVFIPDPNFWGPPSNADAVALTYYTNSDSMIADLKQGNLDWVDQVPFNAVERRVEEEGRDGRRDAGRRDDEHHVELEPAQAQEPRAARSAREEGAVDVRQPRQDDPGRLQRVRDEGREPRRAHLAARESEPRADEVQLQGRRTRRSTSSATSEARTGSASLRRRAASTRRGRTRWATR